MTTALLLTGTLLAVAAAGSGFGKLAKAPRVMDSMAAVGVKPQQVPVLAALEIAGAAGLLVGIWIPGLGIAAAICLTLYFLGAVTSHLRKRHSFAELAPAGLILIIAVAVSYLQLSR